MKDKVIKAINDFDMLSNRCFVVVGVSGGADSMCLLHFLMQISKEKELKIIAAHVNHHLRGEESTRDEEFVKEFCYNNKIELRLLNANVKEEAQKMNCGLEECGRRIRYDFFNSIAKENNAKIATAHTLSDSTETIILNLTRGAGLQGLCGIPPVRGNIIRPLIFVTRAQVEEYCKNNGLIYIIDSSNLNRDYVRNKVRIDVVPLLKQINPSFEQAILRTTTQLIEDKKYIEQIVDKELNKCIINDGFDALTVLKLPKTIRYRVIIDAVYSKCGVRLEAVHVNLISNAIEQGEGTVTITGRYYVKVENNILRIFKNDKPKIKWENKFIGTKILTEQGRTFIIEEVSLEEYYKRAKVNKKLFNNAIDCDTISRSTVIRNRREGDRFTFPRRNLTKTVKKLFNEEKIPKDQRNDIAIIANDDQLLWIEGFGASVFSKVTSTTKKVALIFWEE